MSEIPQNSDIEIRFTNIDSGDISLDSVDDIIVSVARSSPQNDPISITKQSEDPDKFIVGDDNVYVALSPEDFTSETGRFFINLWLSSDGTMKTHLTREVTVEAAVGYE